MIDLCVFLFVSFFLTSFSTIDSFTFVFSNAKWAALGASQFNAFLH